MRGCLSRNGHISMTLSWPRDLFRRSTLCRLVKQRPSKERGGVEERRDEKDLAREKDRRHVMDER